MILTITLNPSMDYIYTIDKFVSGAQNRFHSPTKMTGGKGINASRALSLLGKKVLSFSLIGGTNGKFIKKELEKEAFQTIFFTVDEESRNAITIMHDKDIQTEIVEEGPFVSSLNETKIIRQLTTLLKDSPEINIVTINGSINSSNTNFYTDLLNVFNREIKRDLLILMDVSKEQLINVVGNQGYKPHFIKPNLVEFGELIGTPLNSKEQALEMLKKKSFGIPYLLVSCGEEGAVAQINEQLYDIHIPKIDLVNPTGSGDATVAGAAYAFDNRFDDIRLIKMSMACGISNALENGVGVVQKTVVDKLMDEIKVIKVEK